MNMPNAFVIFVLTIQWSSVASDYLIHIDPSAGKNSDECFSSQVSCRNLSWAFQPQHRRNSTQYVLSPGTHFLTDPTPPFQDLTFLAFTGAGSTVDCTQTEDTGLAFINVKNITFFNITFHGCAALRNSTSRQYDVRMDFHFQLYKFYVALYFFQCSDVNMTSLEIRESPNATGLVLYNTVGNNIFRKSIFSQNRVEDTDLAEYPGGGGVYIEFTYCIPGDITCTEEYIDDSIYQFNQNANYIFEETEFSYNKASNLQNFKVQETYIIPYKRIQNTFGKGGGLGIVLKANASNNSFVILNCNFEGNEAVRGGGMLVEYQDKSSNNTVIMKETVFSGNSAPHSDDLETAGGGVRVGYYVYNTRDNKETFKNQFIVESCEFLDNHALNGGGLSFFPVRQLIDFDDQLFEFTIFNTTFRENHAHIGAALEITVFSLFIEGYEPLVVLDSSRFIDNDIVENSNNSMIREEGIGSVYTNGIRVHCRREISFVGNMGSALAAVSTLVNFTGCNATFDSNHGRDGGGINLLGSAFIVIGDSTSMTFERNKAEVRGGAISNIFIERENNFKTYPNCFVRHMNPFRHPKEWNASFTFVDNEANLLGKSLYTTSLSPCAWAGGSGVGAYSDILCWVGWSYMRNESVSNCSDEINTASGRIIYHNKVNDSNISSNMTIHDAEPIKVIPGEVFRLPLLITDDLKKEINNQTVFTAQTIDTNVSEVNQRYTFVSGEYVQVDGFGGHNTTLLLHTDSERVWHVELDIALQDCPPGFLPSSNDISSFCKCNTDNYQGKITCSQQAMKAHIINGYWFGEIEEYDELVTSLCLPGFCRKDSKSHHKKLPRDANLLVEELCGGENHRKGILCGECEEGYGPAINLNDYQCKPCTGSVPIKDGILYIVSLYVPLLLTFIFIIVFSIRLTSGPANAFIFYAQIVSSTFDLSADRHIPIDLITGIENNSKYLLTAYRLPYGVFNLDYIENYVGPLCIGTGLNALDALELDYVVALFPLLMIAVVVILVKIKNSSYFSYCCSWSFRNSRYKFLRHWKAGESLLHAFSAFLLLSYIKFSLTSSYLINIHAFYNAKGDEVGVRRAYYAGQFRIDNWMYILRYRLPGILVLILITLPPLILFGYPVVWFERLIIKIDCLWRLYPADKVQIFLDTFQGCYRDNRRFFAGMYFAFRLTINVTYILTDNWLQQFVVQQIACTVFIFIIAFCWPYRDEQWYLNYVDLFIFTNLAIVNAFSLYLFTFSQINQVQPPPLWPFILQYILVFLPLAYMVLYVIWYLLKPSHKEALKKCVMMPITKLRKRRRDKFLRTTILGPSEGVRSQSPTTYRNLRTGATLLNDDGITTTEIVLSSDRDLESSSSSDEDCTFENSDDNLEAILVRAETQNTYQSTTNRSTGSQFRSGQASSSRNQFRNSSSRQMTLDSGLGTQKTSRAALTLSLRNNDLSVSLHTTAATSKDKSEFPELSPQKRVYASNYGTIDS